MSVLSYAEKFAKNQTGASRDVFGADDEFWTYYNQLNPQYRAQLDPYLKYNYKAGYKDFIRGMFGMRSNEDAVRESAAAQAWQMLGSLNNDVFQNDFNSAEEAAAREKDAGINPDLTGELQSDPAAQQEQPITPPYIDFLTPPSSFTQDFTAVLDQASRLVSSVSQFETMLTGKLTAGASIGKTIAETEGIHITSAASARKEVTDLLKGMNPEFWAKYTFGDTGMDENLQNDLFNTYFKKYPLDTHKYLKAAISSITSDPALMQSYYEASKGASKGFAESTAYSDVYGSPSLGYDILRINNDAILKYIREGLVQKERYIGLYHQLSNIQNENALSLAEFAKKNHLPEQLGKAELAKAIFDQHRTAQDERKVKAEKEWLDVMQRLRRSDNKEVAAMSNYLIQCYFSGQAASLGHMTEEVRTPFGGNSTTKPWIPATFINPDYQ